MKNMKNMKTCENYEKLIYLNAHLNYFRLQPNFLYFTAMPQSRPRGNASRKPQPVKKAPHTLNNPAP